MGCGPGSPQRRYIFLLSLLLSVGRMDYMGRTKKLEVSS